MKKVIFSGTINGETFDNVEDYNKKISSLIRAGETNISASSSTQIRDEEDEPEEKKFVGVVPSEEPIETAEIKRDGLTDFNFTPLFDDTSNQYYLDYLVSEDPKLNEKLLDRLRISLSNKLDEIGILLADDCIDLDSVMELASRVKEIRGMIDADSKENTEEIKEIHEYLKEKEERMNTLLRQRPFIDVMNNYYQGVWAEIKKYIFRTY